MYTKLLYIGTLAFTPRLYLVVKLGQEEENFVVVFAPPQLFQNDVVLIVLFTKKFEDEFGNVLVVIESDEVYFGAFFNFVGLIKSQKGKYVRTVTCQRGFSEIDPSIYLVVVAQVPLIRTNHIFRIPSLKPRKIMTLKRMIPKQQISAISMLFLPGP